MSNKLRSFARRQAPIFRVDFSMDDEVAKARFIELGEQHPIDGSSPEKGRAYHELILRLADHHGREVIANNGTLYRLKRGECLEEEIWFELASHALVPGSQSDRQEA